MKRSQLHSLIKEIHQELLEEEKLKEGRQKTIMNKAFSFDDGDGLGGRAASRKSQVRYMYYELCGCMYIYIYICVCVCRER